MIEGASRRKRAPEARNGYYQGDYHILRLHIWLISYSLDRAYTQSPCFWGSPVRTSYADGPIQMDEMESRSSGMVDFAHDDFEDQLAMPSMSYRDRVKLTGF